MAYSYPRINIIKTGKRIEELRKEAELSVKDLQEIFGFDSPMAIYKWQWGQSLPTIDNLVLLSSILKVTIEEILVID